MTINYNSEICKQINRIKLNISFFGHAIVGKEWSGKLISPSHSRIYYIVDGNAYITIDEKTIRLVPGKWYIIPAECTFGYCCEDQMEQYYFHIKLCDYDETDLLAKISEPVAFDFEGMNTEILDNYLCNETVIDGLKLQQKMLDKLIDIMQERNIILSHSDYSVCVYNALTYIKQHLGMQLTVGEIAENSFVSESTLTKRFKKEIKTPVSKYVSDMIMVKAEKLLVSSNMSIMAISDKLGFSDPFYFSRKFKLNYGMSPREYRKKMHL